MSADEYIASGILEDYYLGLLTEDAMQEVSIMCARYARVANALADIEKTIEKKAVANATPPPAAVAARIWATIDNLEREKRMDINDLPLIDRFSDHKKWLPIAIPLIPAQLKGNRMCKVLRNKAGVQQTLIVSISDFDDETHTDVLESFLVLEGRCECYIGDDIFCAEAGAYVDIPLHVPHHVKVLSPYIVAILQHIAV